jgi:ParB family chromosome partitioning protein
MSRRDELMKKNQNIRSTAEISESEVLDAQQNHRPRSGQGSFAQRQRLEDRIRELEARVGDAEGRMIPIGDVSPNPWQPRRVFDEEELQKLALSISEIGLVQPIVVRSVSNRDTSFEIIAGERRYRAHQILGRESIRAIVLNVPDADMAAFALAENIDRTDLTAYEIAVAIRNAEQMFPSRTSLASSLGLNRTALYKYLAFFKLPSFVIDDLEANPGLLGRDAADAIVSMLTGGGDQAVASLRAVWPRVKAGDLEQGKIVSTIEAAMKNRVAVRSGRDIKKLFLGSEQAGTITRDDAALTVKIRAAALTPEKEAELRSLVERLFS